MIFSSFVLFVSFVVVYSLSNAEFIIVRIKYQQRKTLQYSKGSSLTFISLPTNPSSPLTCYDQL